MKLPSYKEVLKMGKEKLEETLIPVRANKAKKQAELEMCDLEEKLATKTAEIAELCSAKELNFKKIIEAQDELGLLERKKTQYQNILDQMFPE
jgi:hypothetical protein